jgi:hypothetical protein
MVDGDQWQMGEVDVDGWESGPLSQCEKTARACGSRHACDTKGERGCVVKMKVCIEGGVSCCSIPGQQMSGPSRVKKGSTAGICRSREAEVSVVHRGEKEE